MSESTYAIVSLDDIDRSIQYETAAAPPNRVKCATSLSPGDWFGSDNDGLAVKVTSGPALGRILSAPVDGLALCVIGAVNL